MVKASWMLVAGVITLCTGNLMATVTTPMQEQDVRLLELGKPIERELAGGQTHVYRVMLASGQYLHVVVEQKGIDVVVSLFGPDGLRIIEVDSNNEQGPEQVFVVAETSGIHTLEILSLNKEVAPGRYYERWITAPPRPPPSPTSGRSTLRPERRKRQSNTSTKRACCFKRWVIMPWKPLCSTNSACSMPH
jgi:hypothetical protein